MNKAIIDGFGKIPVKPKTTKYKPKSLANVLTKAIIDYITLNGGVAWRINNVAVVMPDGTRRAGGMVRGIADIHACISGRHISIEVKIGKDKQSPEQIAMQESIEKAGGLYLVAKNMQMVIDYFQLFFKIKSK